jgi:hypothetical protein
MFVLSLIHAIPQRLNAPGSLDSSCTLCRFHCVLRPSANRTALAGVRDEQRLAGSGFINTQQPQTRLELTRATRRRRAPPFSDSFSISFSVSSRISSSVSSSIDALTVSAPLFDSCMSRFAHDLIKLMTHSDEN